ncbi:hypothetical protein LBMAG33_0960 [Candidatus Levyibacteriota bacterium]|nr:hypothetical protein LBMAG33_0960 [Candidatus Levybacteria bacterium]
MYPAINAHEYKASWICPAKNIDTKENTKIPIHMIVFLETMCSTDKIAKGNHARICPMVLYSNQTIIY